MSYILGPSNYTLLKLLNFFQLYTFHTCSWMYSCFLFLNNYVMSPVNSTSKTNLEFILFADSTASTLIHITIISDLSY